MSSLGRSFNLLAAILVIFTAVLHAQIVETGTITGVVRDHSGAVIAKVQVSVQNTATGITTNTLTDAQGLYVTPPLHPGDYLIEFVADGFGKCRSISALKSASAKLPMRF